MKKPFTITYLVSIKISASKGSGKSATAGYFFFETKEGYHFRSIDSLISSRSI